jgi:hypothetical protein
VVPDDEEDREFIVAGISSLSLPDGPNGGSLSVIQRKATTYAKLPPQTTNTRTYLQPFAREQLTGHSGAPSLLQGRPKAY